MQIYIYYLYRKLKKIKLFVAHPMAYYFSPINQIINFRSDMKKIILLLAICLSVGNLFAQDADKLRDEGDAALKAKDYAGALAKYSEYLKLVDYKDTVRVFNCGFCADQADNHAEAVKFFDLSIQNNYNADDAYVGKVKAYREMNKPAEFMATAEQGLKAFPKNQNLEKMVYVYNIKSGQAAQKKKDYELAEKFYKNVLIVSNPTYKGNALYSLGGMFYNVGATSLQAVTPLATSDPDKYKSEKAKADADLKKAKDYLNQALAINPENANAKKLSDAVEAALK